MISVLFSTQKELQPEPAIIVRCQLWRIFKLPATARASFALYNTKQEVDILKTGLIKTMEVMGV